MKILRTTRGGSFNRSLSKAAVRNKAARHVLVRMIGFRLMLTDEPMPTPRLPTRVGGLFQVSS